MVPGSPTSVPKQKSLFHTPAQRRILAAMCVTSLALREWEWQCYNRHPLLEPHRGRGKELMPPKTAEMSGQKESTSLLPVPCARRWNINSVYNRAGPQHRLKQYRMTSFMPQPFIEQSEGLFTEKACTWVGQRSKHKGPYYNRTSVH